MDSPNTYHVNMGNTTKPVQEPINLADQTESVASETICQAYQKATDVGTPINIADVNGLSDHHSENFCKFS